VRPLTLDLSQGHLRPYFFWDEDLSIDELQARLREGPEAERLRLLSKLLREARDIEVWSFVTPGGSAGGVRMARRAPGRCAPAGCATSIEALRSRRAFASLAQVDARSPVGRSK
jgi:hypothetical protein